MNTNPERIHESRLLEFLHREIEKNGNPSEDRIIQTHASFVLLLGPFAYKMKRPVNFGFLDFSTLELRHYYCERELLLNRRTCSGIYLNIVPLYESPDGISFTGTGTPVEYAVKMNRMKENQFLKNILKTRTISERQIERIAAKLKELYDSQVPDSSIASHGEPSVVQISTDENFQQISSYIGAAISNPVYNTLKYYTNAFLDRRGDLFQKRIRENRIKDCHGDLHLEHIGFLKNDICIFDCIEFNDRFRYGDIASDVAFLSMDLDYNHSKELGTLFTKKMAERLNDPGMFEVLDFYKCYRAVVRGKVHSFLTSDETVSERRKIQERKIATSYFHLALHYATIGTSPVVLAMTGMVGSGKSAVARTLSHWLDTDYVSSDVVRKEIAGIPLYNHPEGSLKKELYSTRMNEKTYGEVLQRASRSLRGGRSIIIDASFRTKAARSMVRELAAMHHAPVIFIETVASEATIRKRLLDRTSSSRIVSDARIEDLESIKSKYEPFHRESESAEFLRVTTDGNLEETLQKVLINLSDLRIDLTK